MIAFNRKILFSLLIGIAFSAVAIYFTFKNIPLAALASYLKKINYFWIIPSLAIALLSYAIRVWRWQIILLPVKRVGFMSALHPLTIGFMLNCVLPGRIGEIARPAIYSKRENIAFSKALGTVAIERVIDGLMVSMWLTIALFTIDAGAGPYVWGLRFVPVAVFVTALVLLIAFHRSPQKVGGLLRKILGVFSTRLADFGVGVIERFHGGLSALPDMRCFWAFVFTSAMYWGINAAAFWTLANGCGLELPPAGAVAGMGVLAVGILLPAGPGYFGNFQVAVLAALEMYLPDTALGEPAAVFIFLLYVLQTGLTILFGAGGAIALKRRKPWLTS